MDTIGVVNKTELEKGFSSSKGPQEQRPSSLMSILGNSVLTSREATEESAGWAAVARAGHARQQEMSEKGPAPLAGAELSRHLARMRKWETPSGDTGAAQGSAATTGYG